MPDYQPENTAGAPATEQNTPSGPSTPAHDPAAGAARSVRSLHTAADLPGYSKSLLRIRVPLVVTLASKQQRVGEILTLGPGAIIHFQKSCEEMLDVEVGERRVAQGEAVKVGDKFGIRITSMVLPEEDFVPISRQTS